MARFGEEEMKAILPHGNREDTEVLGGSDGG
jgi:hypothetical protein